MSLVDIELQLPDFAAVAERANRDIPGLIAATLQTQRGMIFDNEGAYNGRRKWQKLKCRKGMILSDTGTLRKSIGPRNDGLKPTEGPNTIVRLSGGLEGTVTIGTSIAYAAVHNYGATIVPVRAKALRFKCGRRWIFAKKVTIPARPFADFTKQDERELVTTVENYIEHLLGSL